MRRVSILLVLSLTALGLMLTYRGLMFGQAAREVSSEAESPALTASQDLGEGATQFSVDLRGANIILRHKGFKQAEVEAGSVEVSRDLNHAVFTDTAHVTLFDRGEPSLRLATNEIVLDRRSNNLLVRGPVKITSNSGDELLAPEAQWINQDQRLLFSSGVTASIGEARLRASRLQVDTRLQVFELEGEVDITFRVPPPEP